jgi:hypothetical protein
MSYSAFNRNVLSDNFSQEDNMGKKTKRGKSLRGKIMETARRGLKTLSAASAETGVSYRQAERIYKRYRAGMRRWFTVTRECRRTVKPAKESLIDPSGYTGETVMILTLPRLRRRCGKWTGRT